MTYVFFDDEGSFLSFFHYTPEVGWHEKYAKEAEAEIEAYEEFLKQKLQLL